MTYTQIEPVRPAITGTTVTLTAAPAGGDAIRPGSFLIVNNGSASAITLTLNMGRGYKGYTITSPTVSVAAGAEVLVGPFDADPFEQLTGTNQGYCTVDYSAVTTVTRASITTA